MAMYAMISQPFPAKNSHRTIFPHGWSLEIQHQPEETISLEYPTAFSPYANAAIIKGIPHAVM